MTIKNRHSLCLKGLWRLSQIECGSEPARDEGLTSGVDVDGYSAFASRLTPTVVSRRVSRGYRALSPVLPGHTPRHRTVHRSGAYETPRRSAGQSVRGVSAGSTNPNARWFLSNGGMLPSSSQSLLCSIFCRVYFVLRSPPYRVQLPH